MSNKTQQSREWRAEQRRLGFSPKLVWINKLDWPRIQAFIDRLKAKRKKEKK
jgi:hypothetical protein